MHVIIINMKQKEHMKKLVINYIIDNKTTFYYGNTACSPNEFLR